MHHILVTSGRTECIIHFHLDCCNRVSLCLCSGRGECAFSFTKCVCVCVGEREIWHICVITWDWMCQVISTSVKESKEERQAI